MNNMDMLKRLKPCLKVTFLQGVIIVFGWLLEGLLTMFRPRIIGQLTDRGLVQANYKALCVWLSALICVSLIEYGYEMIQAKRTLRKRSVVMEGTINAMSATHCSKHCTSKARCTCGSTPGEYDRAHTSGKNYYYGGEFELYKSLP